MLESLPLLPVCIGIAAIALTSFYLYRKYVCHQYFKKRGIPGPEPHWLYGNLHQLTVDNRHEIQQQWARQYGEFYGYYEGPFPIFVTTNVEAVEQICVKQFANFQGHNILPIAPKPEERSLLNQMLFAQGDYWKKLRSAVNPAFSTGKLKSYEPYVTASQDDFMKLLSEKVATGKDFDCHAAFQLLTLDVIAEVGFGLDFKAIRTRGDGNPILRSLRELLDLGRAQNNVAFWLRYLPIFVKPFKILIDFQMRTMTGLFKPIGDLLNLVGQIIRKRLKDAKRNDLLQLMIEASDLVPQKDKTNLLTETEIRAQSFLFFSAGYETTSSMLSYISYLLASHSKVQDKLVAEIYSKYPKHVPEPNPTYDVVMSEMPYLDAVIRETMRLYPIGIYIVHRFVKGEPVVCGIQLDEGCDGALVDVYSIHRNAELWGPVDPSEFYPERFLPENSTNRPDAAFLAFGYGPRQCIGMRLSLFEMKLTLVNLLHRFKILEPEGGYPPGGIKVSSRDSSLLLPVDGVQVRLQLRQ